jgi:hypothetical protein
MLRCNFSSADCHYKTATTFSGYCASASSEDCLPTFFILFAGTASAQQFSLNVTWTVTPLAGFANIAYNGSATLSITGQNFMLTGNFTDPNSGCSVQQSWMGHGQYPTPVVPAVPTSFSFDLVQVTIMANTMFCPSQSGANNSGNGVPPPVKILATPVDDGYSLFDQHCVSAERILWLVVKVTNAGISCSGVPVSFEVIQQPSGATGTALTTPTAVTGGGGMASTGFTLGSVAGLYQVTAFCSSCTPTSVGFAKNASCEFLYDGNALQIQTAKTLNSISNNIIWAVFTPGGPANPMSLADAAKACGFAGFNWQQTMTATAAPSSSPSLPTARFNRIQ